MQSARHLAAHKFRSELKIEDLNQWNSKLFTLGCFYKMICAKDKILIH